MPDSLSGLASKSIACLSLITVSRSHFGHVLVCLRIVWELLVSQPASHCKALLLISQNDLKNLFTDSLVSFFPLQRVWSCIKQCFTLPFVAVAPLSIPVPLLLSLTHRPMGTQVSKEAGRYNLDHTTYRLAVNDSTTEWRLNEPLWKTVVKRIEFNFLKLS